MSGRIYLGISEKPQSVVRETVTLRSPGPLTMISLVIPTLNEVDNIEPLLARIAGIEPAPDQIIFVDDGSTDGTRERIRSPGWLVPGLN